MSRAVRNASSDCNRSCYRVAKRPIRGPVFVEWQAWVQPVLRGSDGGARVWCGVRTFAAAPLPNSGARSVIWRGDCSECVRGVMTLYVCVVGDGNPPCTDGSRGPPF